MTGSADWFPSRVCAAIKDDGRYGSMDSAIRSALDQELAPKYQAIQAATYPVPEPGQSSATERILTYLEGLAA
jgi:Arc/MetJ-type ribon-helix-helix transcriptional regulator